MKKLFTEVNLCIHSSYKFSGDFALERDSSPYCQNIEGTFSIAWDDEIPLIYITDYNSELELTETELSELEYHLTYQTDHSEHYSVWIEDHSASLIEQAEAWIGDR